MAVQKRQQGRPKRNEDAKENIQTNEATETKVAEKVIEVTTEKPKAQKPREVRKSTFGVYVKGKYREVSKLIYDAISKDPKLEVTLPKGSPLAVKLEPKDPNCKDC